MSSTRTVSEHRSSTVLTFNNRLTAVKYLLNTNAHHTKLKLSTCGGFFLKNPSHRAAKYATFLTDRKEVIYATFLTEGNLYTNFSHRPKGGNLNKHYF